MNKFIGLLEDNALNLIASVCIMVFSPFQMLFIILMAMIVLDTLFGSYYAMRIKRFSTKQFKRFINKIIIYFTSIITIRLVEIGLTPLFETTAITHIMASFLIVMEAASVLKNLTLLGAPLPAGIIKVITSRIKNQTLEELVDSGMNRQEYIEEVIDMINYQLPAIKTETMRQLLKIKFEEWARAINVIDIQFSDKDTNNNDLIFYRISSWISKTTNIVEEKWKEAGLPDECINSYNKWHAAKAEKWLADVKDICYSSGPIGRKVKQIIERKIVTLYQTIVEIQKGQMENGCRRIKNIPEA